MGGRFPRSVILFSSASRAFFSTTSTPARPVSNAETLASDSSFIIGGKRPPQKEAEEQRPTTTTSDALSSFYNKRKICKNCRCKREEHDIKAEENAETKRMIKNLFSDNPSPVVPRKTEQFVF